MEVAQTYIIKNASASILNNSRVQMSAQNRIAKWMSWLVWKVILQ